MRPARRDPRGVARRDGPPRDRVIYVRLSRDEHERVAQFAADRSVTIAEAARSILGDRLATSAVSTSGTPRRNGPIAPFADADDGPRGAHRANGR